MHFIFKQPRIINKSSIIYYFQLNQPDVTITQVSTSHDSFNHLPRVSYAANDKTAMINLPTVVSETVNGSTAIESTTGSSNGSAQYLLQNDEQVHSKRQEKPKTTKTATILPLKCSPLPVYQNSNRIIKNAKNSQVH